MNVSSMYIYRRSFLQPTKTIGVCGQNRRISGHHITLQFFRDVGFAIEKQRRTTSDLKMKLNNTSYNDRLLQYHQYSSKHRNYLFYLPYANLLSLSWSPNVSHKRNDTLTPSTYSHDLSSTYNFIYEPWVPKFITTCHKQLHLKSETSVIVIQYCS